MLELQKIREQERSTQKVTKSSFVGRLQNRTLGLEKRGQGVKGAFLSYYLVEKKPQRLF